MVTGDYPLPEPKLTQFTDIYRKISNISHTKFQNLKVSHLVLQLSVINEDVVGAAPTGDAPTTSELSTIILPTKVCLVLEVWRYIHLNALTFTSWWQPCDSLALGDEAVLLKLISPLCRIYASLNQVTIGSDNGFLAIQHQAII